MRLLDFWTGLGDGAPVLLFLCLALDKHEPPPDPRSGLERLLQRGPRPVAEDLEEPVLEFIRRTGGIDDDGWGVLLEQLSLIHHTHLDPWIDRVKSECRDVPDEHLRSARTVLLG